MFLDEGMILRMVKSLYGITKRGLHCYLTYLEHHLEALGMTRAKADPRVLMRHVDGKLDGLALLQVDDTLELCSVELLLKELNDSLELRSQTRINISTRLTSFNGLKISKKDGTFLMTQTDKIDKLRMAKTEKELAGHRAM